MSEFVIGAWIIVFILLILIAFTSIKILAPREQLLLTRFGGRHVGTFDSPGIKIKLPWPITIVANNGRQISTQLQQIDETLETKTIDDVFIGLPISVQFEIEDSSVFVFNNDEPIRQMRSLVAAEVRRYAAKKDSQEIYDEREEISEGVISRLKDELADDYGLMVRRIVIDEPSMPAEIERAYNAVRASERELSAAKNEAEAIRVKEVAKAEAEKQRNILMGEGYAGQRKAIFDQYAEQISALVAGGASREEAVSTILFIMAQDTIRDSATGEANTIIFAPDGSQDSISEFLRNQQAFKV